MSLTIPSRFNGPLHSGNGGYCAGVVAGLVGGVAEVSLRRPVPLDTPLEVLREDGSVRVLDGGELVLEGRPGELDVEVPSPVSVEEARAATERYRGPSEGLFSRCFVCGREREDSLGVFAGAVEGRDLVASPWTPASEDPELVWAVLDCPTYFALYPDDLPMSFLARFGVKIEAPVRAGEEHVVIAWPMEKDGRKHHAGSAVLSADGDVLAVARALLIQAK